MGYGLDGWIRGADAEYDRMCEYSDAREAAIEVEVGELLACEGTVEAAIGEQADCIRALLQSGKPADLVVAGIHSVIRSYIERQAVDFVDRRGA